MDLFFYALYDTEFNTVLLKEMIGGQRVNAGGDKTYRLTKLEKILYYWRMNTLIADSGASKTDWVLLSEGSPQFVQTDGLNPKLVTAEKFLRVLSVELKPNLTGKAIHRIYFYGAGCGSSQKKKEVKGYLAEVFEFAEISVGTDLEAAGLAILGDREGIVCILGTGSSAGFYSSGKIGKEMDNKEYPQGDEGSGSDIGKKVLELYLKEELKSDLRKFLEQKIPIDLKELYVELQDPAKAKLLVANVSKVLSSKSGHPQMQKVIYNGFTSFLERVKGAFPEELRRHEVSFVGSVASVYEAELRACAKQMDIELASVVRSPIEHIALHFSRETS